MCYIYIIFVSNTRHIMHNILYILSPNVPGSGYCSIRVKVQIYQGIHTYLNNTAGDVVKSFFRGPYTKRALIHIIIKNIILYYYSVCVMKCAVYNITNKTNRSKYLN